MNEPHILLGSLIREFRLRKQMSQIDLANKLGYASAQFISLFERGISKIPHETLGQLISILGVPEKKVTGILVNAFEMDLKEKINRGKS